MAICEPPVRLWRDGSVAHLQLARPAALNAIDVAAAEAFSDSCAQLARMRDVRAVVVSGEGNSFCAGGDLNEFRRNRSAGKSLIDPLHSGLSRLASLDAPVIASLQGNVAGAGMSLALACDFALAASDTRFNLAYVRIGASCDGGASWMLPRLVGLRKALEIALLADTLDAAAALELGLVNRVLAPDALQGETADLARRLSSGPTVAMGHIKRLMRESFFRDFKGQLEAERAAFLRNAGTRDFGEGLSAFFARRPPSFEGSW